MNDVIERENNQKDSRLMPGAFLKAEREKRELSIDRVATKLHLRASLIERLEADDFDSLPRSVYVKCYYRSYGKLLGVPTDAIVEAYDLLYLSQPSQEKVIRQVRPFLYEKSSSHLKWWMLVALLLFVGFGIWWERHVEFKDVPSSQLFTVSSEQHTQAKRESTIPINKITTNDIQTLQKTLALDNNVSIVEKDSAR